MQDIKKLGYQFKKVYPKNCIDHDVEILREVH